MDMHVIAKLEQFIATNIIKQPSRKIEPNEPLITSGLIDSFSLVEVALFVEDEFGVKIDDTELNAEVIDNLEMIAALIMSRSNG